MRVFFMGGHELGAIVLEELLHSCIKVVGVYTTKTNDSWYSGVDRIARKNNLLHIESKDVNSVEVIRTIQKIKPNLIISVNFNQIIKKELLDIPNLGSINIHASLLPKYRGRAPLNWAILNGEENVGITVHYIDEGIDTGQIILQKSIDAKERYIDEILSEIKLNYPKMILETIEIIEKGDFNPVMQATPKQLYWRKRVPEDGIVKKSMTCEQIYNLVRAISKPYPGAYMMYNDKKVVIWRVSLSEIDFDVQIGSIVAYDEELYLKMLDGSLIIESYGSDIKLLDGMVLNDSF